MVVLSLAELLACYWQEILFRYVFARMLFEILMPAYYNFNWFVLLCLNT